MDDLISRKAAIDQLHQSYNLLDAERRLEDLPSAQPDPCEELDFVQEHKKIPVVLDIQQKEKSMPSPQLEQQWIPVDLQNNSPEENKVVLLGVRFRDDFKYFVTSRQDYNYWIGLGREIKGELKWQPLPEPYREEGD